MAFDIDDLRIQPGELVDLNDIDPRSTPSWADDPSGDRELDKASARAHLEVCNARLEELQELLYAEGKHRVLVVLQAMDAGGKDGTIRHVFEHVNPQGVKVTSFKKPSSLELAHDYLWRIHAHVPGNGEMAVFNRSHYEDVLVVRVNDLVPERQWRKRYRHIRDFEQMLADEGTTIVKIFLHISPDEQAERFQSRLDEPHKHWKFSHGDLEVRTQWNDYMRAFEDALGQTSTDDAPWYVVPADRKWYRNVAVCEIMVQTLESLAMDWPAAEDDLDDVVIPEVD
ncbi:MAG: polyphosphate kinase 2 family protein [Acidimicrobiales bacterium]